MQESVPRTSRRPHQMLDEFTESSWAVFDDVDLPVLFRERFTTLQSCPQCVRGRFRQACRKALQARHDAVNADDELMEERSWKMFCLLPFLLLHRPENKSTITKEVLYRRFDLFGVGAWDTFVDEAVASIPQARPTARRSFDMEDRGKAACQKVKFGEITRARQCLTGAVFVPGNGDTFDELQRKRPQEIQRELPEHVRGFVPESLLALDRDAFMKSLKTSPRGSSPGPGGCTYEHLKVLLDETDIFELLFDAVTSLAQARVPASISKALTSARLTAVTKKDGGVRGIATGCSLRRLTARTLAKQFAKEFEKECAPFQYALSTRAGTDCVGHLLRAATEANPRATVLSVDGIGAYDHVLRAAMLSRLERMQEAKALIPFVMPSYSEPSTYVR